MASLKAQPGIKRFTVTALVVQMFVTFAIAQANFSLMRDLAISRYGQSTAEFVDEWHAEIETMKSLPDSEKLEYANNFFNSRIRWSQDSDTWQENDYWATPLELMGRGMGDCEDFAIAKYATLVLADVDITKLRITYVKARTKLNKNIKSRAHMVLAYYPSATEEPVILDNLVPEIRPASARSDLIPVYGFNSQGIWVGGATTPATTQPGTKLSRWRNLLRRAAAEGLQ